MIEHSVVALVEHGVGIRIPPIRGVPTIERHAVFERDAVALVRDERMTAAALDDDVLDHAAARCVAAKMKVQAPPT